MRQQGGRVLSARDRRLLRLIGEQYLLTLPQLAYVAGRSQRTARWLRTRWQRAGLANAAPLLVGEPTFVWLTRRGLAVVGRPWKQVRPTYQNAERWALLVELRLAAADRYPAALWVSRRALAHEPRFEPPLPDALLEAESATVAVVARSHGLDRRALGQRVAPIVCRYEQTLLVLPHVGTRVREWCEEFGGRVSVIGWRRDPRHVALPDLPRLRALEPALAKSVDGWPMRPSVARCGVFATPPHNAPVP